MFSLVFAARRSLAAALQTRRHLVLENLALRHQVLAVEFPQVGGLHHLYIR